MAEAKPKTVAKKKAPKPYLSRDPKVRMAAVKAICLRISETTLSIEEICKSNPEWPSKQTFFTMKRENAEFEAMYQEAKQAQADFIVEEIVEIADDARNDFMQDKNGNDAINHENVQRSRLRIDTRKWVAASLRPDKYGEKKTIDHKLTMVNMDDRELEALIRSLAAKAGLGCPDKIIDKDGSD